MTEWTPVKAIRAFFNTDGYEPLTSREIMDLKKDSQESYEELGRLAVEAMEQMS